MRALQLNYAPETVFTLTDSDRINLHVKPTSQTFCFDLEIRLKWPEAQDKNYTLGF